jgi:hypothetical protein
VNFVETFLGNVGKPQKIQSEKCHWWINPESCGILSQIVFFLMRTKIQFSLLYYSMCVVRLHSAILLSFVLRWIVKHDRRSTTWNQYSVKWAKLTVHSASNTCWSWASFLVSFLVHKNSILSLTVNTIKGSSERKESLEFLLSFLRVNSRGASREKIRVDNRRVCFDN